MRKDKFLRPGAINWSTPGSALDRRIINKMRRRNAKYDAIKKINELVENEDIKSICRIRRK